MPKLINLLPDAIVRDRERTFTLYREIIISLISLILFLLFNLILLFFSIRSSDALEAVLARQTSVVQQINEFESVEQRLFLLKQKLLRYSRFNRDNPFLNEVWGQFQSFADEGVSVVNVRYNEAGILTATAESPSLRQAADFLIALKDTENLSAFTVTEVGYDIRSEVFLFVTEFDLSVEEEMEDVTP